VACLGHERVRVVLGLARVHDDRKRELRGKLELRGERQPLAVPRRVVVVVVETALAHGNRTTVREPADPVHVARPIETGGIVRVHAGREPREPAFPFGEGAGPRGGRERLPNAQDAGRAGRAGALDHRGLVLTERGVGQVGVAVEERGHGTGTRG
jgi:hypothetical protein